MNLSTQRAVVVAVACWVLPLHAAESFIEADLNGDGRLEQIVLTTITDGGFGSYRVSVGGASFSGEYFAGSGELPKMHVVRLDAMARASQIRVDLPWASLCTYLFLSYDGQIVRPLVTLDSNHCLHEPLVLGNGEITLEQWEGFWTSTRRFKLTGEPQRLQSVPQRFYDLNVSGIASRRIPLCAEGSNEVIAYLEAGRRLSITRFDSQTDKYLIVGDGESRGWARVSAQEIEGLPWAD